MKAVPNFNPGGAKNYIIIEGETSIKKIFEFAKENNAIFEDEALIAFGDDSEPKMYTREKLMANIDHPINNIDLCDNSGMCHVCHGSRIYEGQKCPFCIDGFRRSST